MIQEDFYTGEPVQSGSPPSLTSNIINTNPSQAEVEAASMASFGKYDYDPGSRQVYMQPVPMGGNPAFGYQQPMGGIGAPPQYYNPYGGYNNYNGYYSQFGNPQPTYGQYRQGYYNYYPQQQPVQQAQYYTVPGVNFSGEFMPSADYQDTIFEMQKEYWTKSQETEAKQAAERSKSVYGGYGGFGNNYYGMPYFNPYQYNSLNNEFTDRIRKMQDEARENRMNFNLYISRLAHNFAKDGISEEAIRERYTGRSVELPQSVMLAPQEYQEQVRLANMVPFDNSNLYRQHWNQVSAEFNKVIPEDSNMNDTFGKMGIIAADWEMEEEMHRRRNAGNLYNSGDSSYKYFVRRKAQERYAAENGTVVQNPVTQFSVSNSFKQGYLNSMPRLSQNATLADDGSLNVSINLPCNVGSHAGETYTVHNSQEAEYDKKRERFGAFLDSIPGNIYLDNQKQDKLEKYNYG